MDGTGAPDAHHAVGEYFRLDRTEIPPPPGSDHFAELVGRAAVDAHQRNAAGGLLTGGLLTGLDSIGGLLCGISVLPQWIVTTSLMLSVAQLDHRGPLRLHGRVLRRGRSSVVSALDVRDEGWDDRPVAAAIGTFAVLDPGAMELGFTRPLSIPMGPPDTGVPGPEEFFRIEPGPGPVIRLSLEDHLRNPWGILHGGAVAVLADVAACRAVDAHRSTADPGQGDAGSGTGPATGPTAPVAAADTVLHYLSPARTGPVEARCRVLGGRTGRTGRTGRWVVRVAIHDVGADDRLCASAAVTVLAV